MAAICVFCASSSSLDDRWLRLAAQTGELLARRGHTLISGGGRVGMMGMVALAARQAGGHTVGVIPRQLIALEVADMDADEQIITESLAVRKSVMIDRSDAFLSLHGGLGTLDELFEVWTTAALGLHHKPVVLVNCDNYYTALLDWLAGLVDAGFARPDALSRLIVRDSVPDALDAIEARVG